VSDRKDRTVRVRAEQVITRQVAALERNARSRICFDVAAEDLALHFAYSIWSAGREESGYSVPTITDRPGKTTGL
jgi:hypothetical protein